MRTIRIKRKRYIKCGLIVLLLLVPLSAFGQTCPPGQVCIENPLQTDNIMVVLGRILNWIFTIAVVGIGPVMYIIAGFRFITAAGDPEKINTAKKMALWTSIGLMIAIAAKGIVVLIGEILGVEITFI